MTLHACSQHTRYGAERSAVCHTLNKTVRTTENFTFEQNPDYLKGTCIKIIVLCNTINNSVVQ